MKVKDENLHGGSVCPVYWAESIESDFDDYEEEIIDGTDDSSEADGEVCMICRKEISQYPDLKSSIFDFLLYDKGHEFEPDRYEKGAEIVCDGVSNPWVANVVNEHFVNEKKKFINDTLCKNCTETTNSMGCCDEPCSHMEFTMSKDDYGTMLPGKPVCDFDIKALGEFMFDQVNDEGYTPLMEAAREGHLSVVKCLLRNGANINAETEETHETALTLAACGGFLDVVDTLYNRGAEIELGASTPLMEAAQEGHFQVVK